ncbi:MAG: hypothetical protein K2K97_03170, partial [Muribaculaceae bacterium]|nr:hypothetical protein [Muribaculaceae bacterium]
MRKLMLLIASISVLNIEAQTSSTDSLATSGRELEEIVVRGEKPQMTSRDGTIVIDLPAIVKDKPATNILEALGYVPGV